MAGTGSLAASAATSPKPRVRPLGLWISWWFLACTSDAGTPQRAAAALSSICRAAAPQRRIGMKKWRVVREPSVSWLPKRASSPCAWTTRTLAQSASSSSARIIGTPVRTP